MGLLNQEEPQVLILGPEGSGKTTLLYRLKFGKRWDNMEKELDHMRQETLGGEKNPDYDAGYHYEEFATLGNCGMWDVPGCAPMRAIWSMFYHAMTVHVVFFVVDGRDAYLASGDKGNSEKRRHATERILQAKEHLHNLMNEDELRRAVFAVIINEWPETTKKDAARKKKEDRTAHPMYWRLGLDDVHPSCKERVAHFIIDCNEITGEQDPAFQEVVSFCKSVLCREDISYGMEDLG